MGCVKVFGPVGEAEEAEGLLGDAGAGLGVELEDGGEAGVFADPDGGVGPAPVAVTVGDGVVIGADFDEDGEGTFVAGAFDRGGALIGEGGGEKEQE